MVQSGSRNGQKGVRVAGLRSLLKGGALLIAALAGIDHSALFAREAPAAAPPSAQAQRPPRPPRPAIWLIEDNDTKIYLFGTIHVFPASLDWRSPRLDQVIREADELVMETPDASAAEMFDSDRLFRPMMMGKSVPLLSRVSPEARPALQAVLEATPLQAEVYDEMHLWAVAFLLQGYMLSQAYAEEGQAVAMTGAEEVLGEIFRKSRRPISGVETVEEQIAVFSTMPLAVQRRFLEATVLGDGSGEAAEPSGVPMTDDDWISGDVEAIAAGMQEMAPELYEPLLTRRNRNWTGWLSRRMERPGTVLFAVGAGHLAGPQSVQRMLAERGITARRID